MSGRIERPIAIGRVGLAVFSLLAIWLDSPEPTRHVQTAYALLTGYIFYALLLALLVWRSYMPLGRLGLITHACDLSVFSLFMHFTEGLTSPVFVYFVFSLVCATLRWQWRGTLWTAVAALAIFIGIGAYAAEVLHDPGFELNRFIIRSVSLAVVAALLGYLGAYEQRLRSTMFKLAAWPRAVPQAACTLVHDVLEQTAAILGAPRALMVWEGQEEPWLYLASWSRGEFHWTREPPATFEPLIAEPLVDTSFLCPDARAPAPMVLHTSSAGPQRWHGTPLHPDLQARFAIGAVLSVGLRGETFTGRLFFPDKRGMTSDDLALGEIVARQVVAHLDQFYLFQRLQQAAVSEERIRLSRDLHDGLLQSLTAAALELETAHRLLEEDPRAAKRRLLEIQRLIADEQRDLRGFIRGLRSALLSQPEADFSLASRLKEVSRRIERQWGLRAELSMKRLEGWISQALASEIYHIVHEALVNAARHAHASAVRVELGVEDSHVRITVADNGRGFPFHGHYALAALTTLHLGPRTLTERIAALGGALALDSTAAGACLDIRLPLAPLGAYDAHSPGLS